MAQQVRMTSLHVNAHQQQDDEVASVSSAEVDAADDSSLVGCDPNAVVVI